MLDNISDSPARRILQAHLKRSGYIETGEISDAEYAAKDIALFIDSNANLEPDSESDVSAAVQNYVDAAARIVALPSFQEMIQETMAPKHCVRCHEDYSDRDGEDACVIPHMFSADPSYSAGDVHIYDAVCCRRERIKEDGWNVSIFRTKIRTKCFEGEHTTNAKSVEHLYNDRNIVRCDLDTSGKCRRIPLDPTDDAPIFDG